MLLIEVFSTRAILCWAVEDLWKLSVLQGGLKFTDLAMPAQSTGVGVGHCCYCFACFQLLICASKWWLSRNVKIYSY